MNPTASTASRPWPAQVELRRAGDTLVVGADGIRVELDAFRDACRGRAAELRRQAIAEARQSLRATVRKAIHALARTAGHGRAVVCRDGIS